MSVEPAAIPAARQAPAPAAPLSRPVSSADDPATTFVPQAATRWLRPGLLLRSAGEVVISKILGEYNDKREVMAALPSDPPLDLHTDHQDVWFDFVSDTGDGFDATYAVAELLARPSLSPRTADGSELELPAGRLLVMGGDQCYPSASVDGYENRLIGPYRAALPHAPETGQRHLLAVPGNHDWYDGLTAFMRTFCQGRDFGGWLTGQSRSYFTARLPGRWWLWAVDIQFDTYIDDVQLRYLRARAEQLQPGDAVILCSAKPSWVAAQEPEHAEAYSTLDFLDRTLIRPTGAHLRVCLSGDLHHYARYEAADGAQKVTAGGGGAYLSATHHLPRAVTVPPPASRARGRTEPVRHDLRASYPAPAESRRAGLGVLGLPWTTKSFTLLMGGVQTLVFLAIGWAFSPQTLSLGHRLVATAERLADATPGRLAATFLDSLGSLTLALLVVGAAVAFTKQSRSIKGWLVGSVHGLLQLTLAVLVTYAAVSLTAGLPSVAMLVATLALVFVVGGIVATELVAVYLVLADRVGLNSNELFAAQAIGDFKNFLRLQVDATGELVIHPIGVRRVPRHWRVAPSDSAGPRFVPDGTHALRVGGTETVECQLIEDPVRVSPDPRPVTA